MDENQKKNSSIFILTETSTNSFRKNQTRNELKDKQIDDKVGSANLCENLKTVQNAQKNEKKRREMCYEIIEKLCNFAARTSSASSLCCELLS